MSKTHRLLLLPVLLFIFAAPAFADPMVIVDTETLLTIRAVEGGVIDTKSSPFMFEPTNSGFWSAAGTISQFNTTVTNPSDSILIVGVVQHIMSPTGHNDGAGLSNNFNITVNAANAVFDGNIGIVMSTKVFSVAHGPNGHLDLLTVTLQANVLRDGAVNHILGWTFTVDVVHTPEPATMALLGMGLTGVAIKIRRSRRSSKIRS